MTSESEELGTIAMGPVLSPVPFTGRVTGPDGIAVAYAGVYVSLDRAETWATSTGIPVTHVVQGLARMNGEHVAVAASTEEYSWQVYLSQDGGLTWTAEANDLPADLDLVSLVDADDTVMALGRQVREDYTYDWSLWQRVEGTWHQRLAFPYGVTLSAPLVQYGDAIYAPYGGVGLVRIVAGE